MIEEPNWHNCGIGSAISSRFLELYASVVMQQTVIEYNLQFCIACLLGLDHDKLQILTAELSYRQLIGLLSSSMISRFSEKSEEYLKLRFILSKLDEFEKFRNALVHSIWFCSETGFKNSGASRLKITAKRKTGLKKIEESVTEDELETAWKKGSFYSNELRNHIKTLTFK